MYSFCTSSQDYVYLSYRVMKISVASNETPTWNTRVHRDILYLYILFDHY